MSKPKVTTVKGIKTNVRLEGHTMKNIQGNISTLKKWERADNYMGTDFSEYYVGGGRCRDSNELEESNFAATLERLGGESKSVVVAHSSHWAVGWVEQILVHPRATAKVRELAKIKAELAEYPVLDEDDFFQRENDSLEERLENNLEYYKGELRKALKLETLEGMFPKRHVEQFLREVIREDASYCGNNSAGVCAESILRYVENLDRRTDDKNRVVKYIQRHA